MPNVTPPEASRKASMVPGMVKVKVLVMSASVMPNPLAVGMNVGCLGGAVRIAVGAVFRRRLRLVCARWPVGRNVPTVMLFIFGIGTLGGHQQAEKCERHHDPPISAHSFLQMSVCSRTADA